MLTLKTVTFFVAHVFLKRLCLPMPSLSIDCRSLLQAINCNANKNSEISPHPTIVNDIPLYSHNFYRLLYEIVVCDVFFFKIYLLFKPRCAYFWILSLLGPALKLWLDKKIYTVERLKQTYYDVRIIRVSVLS